MILLVNALNWPFSLRCRILRMHSAKSEITICSHSITDSLRVNQSSPGRVMLYIYEGVIRGGCAAATLCGFSFARDGRDAANGSFDAVHSLDCCADCSEFFCLSPHMHHTTNRSSVRP